MNKLGLIFAGVIGIPAAAGLIVNNIKEDKKVEVSYKDIPAYEAGTKLRRVEKEGQSLSVHADECGPLQVAGDYLNSFSNLYLMVRYSIKSKNDKQLLSDQLYYLMKSEAHGLQKDFYSAHANLCSEAKAFAEIGPVDVPATNLAAGDQIIPNIIISN